VLLPLLQNNLLESGGTVVESDGSAAGVATCAGVGGYATAIEVVYLDASVSGPTDPDAAWTDDSNAFDGSTAIWASTTTTGGITLNELSGKGHSGTAAQWDQILDQRHRIYAAHIGASGVLFSAVSPRYISSSTSSDAAAYTVWLDFSEEDYGWSETTFDEIETINYLVIGGEARLFRIEVEWTYRPDVSFSIYSFDASDEGPTDAQSVWTDEAKAFDGITGSWAQLATTSDGSSTNNALVGGGTNAPASGIDILGVYARSKAKKGGYSDIQSEIYTDGKGELLATVADTSRWQEWTDWIELDEPSGGWTWAKVQALEVYSYGVNFSGRRIGGCCYNVGRYLYGFRIGWRVGGFGDYIGRCLRDLVQRWRERGRCDGLGRR
jgi:hypothetical protein